MSGTTKATGKITAKVFRFESLAVGLPVGALVVLMVWLVIATVTSSPNQMPHRNPAVTQPAAVVEASQSAANVAQGQSREPYDMRGIQLGITLAELRAAQLPSEPGKTDLDIECNTEELQRQACYLTSKSATTGYSSRHETTLGDARGKVFFNFIRDSNKQLRLNEISFTADMDQLDGVLDPMFEKYGSPDVSEQAVENGYGATFDQYQVHWSNQVSSIELVTRCGKVHRFCIFYTHKALADFHEAYLTRTQGTAEDRL